MYGGNQGYQQSNPYGAPQQQQQQQQQYGSPYGAQGAQGGYGAPGGAPGYGRPQPPPPQQQRQPGFASDAQLHQWFAAVDQDRSGAITQDELKQALVNGDWTQFSDETVKMLMSIFDTDHTGTISFDEFRGVFQYVQDWRRIFANFDADRSGTIQHGELTQALGQFGYHLSPRLVHLLILKYSPPPASKGRMAMPGPGAPMPSGPSFAPGVTFNRFVRCCVTVRHLSDGFRAADHDQDGYVQMSHEQFLEICFTAP